MLSQLTATMASFVLLDDSLDLMIGPSEQGKCQYAKYNSMETRFLILNLQNFSTYRLN